MARWEIRDLATGELAGEFASAADLIGYMQFWQIPPSTVIVNQIKEKK